MLNLLTFIIGIIGIFLIARYNKSNKLFWLLVISMMSGFIGGTIAANMKSDKKSNVEYVSQNMTPCSMPAATFLPVDGEYKVVPTVETSVVTYVTTSTKTLLEKPNFTTIYHEGLIPFIFDSS